jgi:hypothetical protein
MSSPKKARCRTQVDSVAVPRQAVEKTENFGSLSMKPRASNGTEIVEDTGEKMKTILRLKFYMMLGVISLSLSACGASAPGVELGYLPSGNYNQVPTVFVDYEPGMTISAIHTPLPADLTVRFSIYKESVTYVSGQKIDIEFFVTKVNPTEYEASINGSVKPVPAYTDYLKNVESTLKDKLAFTFMMNGFAEPLMKFPPLCAEGSGEVHQQYSHVPANEFLKSLDYITFKCPATGKTDKFEFTYERDPSDTDGIITGFTVKTSATTAQ